MTDKNEKAERFVVKFLFLMMVISLLMIIIVFKK